MVFCSIIICLPFTLNLLSFLFLCVVVLDPVQRGVVFTRRTLARRDVFPRPTSSLLNLNSRGNPPQRNIEVAGVCSPL